ncbi:hypothetical protein DL766_003598 [Monosporascus sp. MC13-8B]|uniref:asparaginase n=1 Tax=Monosporascus cannonballus TaxID=155416 RepID=A0ABY0HF26_9PEZI|nr:hypothetical protein DL762_003336 [Monosporascus cannonballus]RYP00538.1 hypothetical protein DL763_000735 [Monosporascus cannonballus]RYP33166.1 hypothetical protein DL766_003598 [Monosporascus sp. MC13-8B]
MLAKLLFFASLIFGALASPVQEVKSEYDDGIEWISKNSSLPKIIALDNINYGRGPRPTTEELIDNVTEVWEVAQLGIVEFEAPGGSSGVNSSLYLDINRVANRQLCSEGSDIAGAIMFHGTNTLEETVRIQYRRSCYIDRIGAKVEKAFGVDLTFNCSKPFIATGAMRPNTYISPDGPSNFYQAVAAAASPSSRDRGGLIVFNDRITSIYYSAKTNANTPDTFKSIEHGNLGVLLAVQPYYFFSAAYPTGRPYFDVTNVTELPSIITFFGHQGFDASLMYAAVANGAKGLVIMGAGAAHLSPSATEAAEDLFNKGIPTIAVARPSSGSGVPGVYPGSVFFASFVGAEQAPIMLQLAIAAGYSFDQIRDLFESPLRNAIYGPTANQHIYYSS